ncbi:MAG: GNAT family N-acetyltransferase [Oscillospiraceae bacterium]|nr:GNAT family N-acetyltransferase [Oscillospiraceae bacterium]
MDIPDASFLRTDEFFLRLDRSSEADPERELVPACHFSICDPDGTVMGRCDLRVGHNEKLYYGGNIGYGIFPDCRGRRLAEKACRLLFELARRLGMTYLYITCSPDNLPSRRTCERLGGKLLEIAELPEDNDMRRDRRCTHACIYRYEL